jgi:hypothetical protein
MTKRYQRGNQNLYIEEQTTQWPKDTKGVIRICILKKDRQHNGSDYPFGIFWSLCCLSFNILILITPLISVGHCVVCPSSIYRFWLPFGIFWSLCWESVYWRRTDNTMTKRYQRGNQNLYIEEEQTTQWPTDTKGVIRICILKKNRQHNGQKIPKG